ncbi:hypothetical protein vseg_005834 [Gypsophila vaccaria]
MYDKININSKWEKYYQEYDSKNPTFSSTLLDKINKSLKNNNNPVKDRVQDTRFFSGSTTNKGTRKADVDEKIASLRRACLVEKWMDGKKLGGGDQKVVPTKKSPISASKSRNNSLLREFDAQDAWFCGNTLSTSTSSSEAEYYYSANNNNNNNYTRHPRQLQQHLPRVACFAPPMPKPVRTTRTVESKKKEKKNEDDEEMILKSKSRALKIYSNLKNMKQPISPGVKLTSFINSLFTKNNERNKCKNRSSVVGDSVRATSKIKPTSYSACTTPRSYSKSCLSSTNDNDNDNDNDSKKTKKKFQGDNGTNKRTVRFCPISVVLDERSRPCGQKSVFEDQCQQMSSSSLKFGRSLSKTTYDELKNINNKKKIEEVAIDLLSGYCWDSRPGGNDNKTDRGKVNEGDHGVNYVQREDNKNNNNNNNNNYDYDDNDNDNDNDDDGLSCSSSDLFELDHLNLIGNELPVYETTRFDPKLH